MKTTDKILMVAMIVVMMVVMTGCRTKYVTIPEYHTRYVTKTDTLAKTDSVYVKDSVAVYQKGDTVYVSKLAFRDRYHNIYKVKCDTIIRRDSIAVPYPVERQLTFMERMQRSIGWFFAFVMAAIVVAMVIKIWWYRNKTC